MRKKTTETWKAECIERHGDKLDTVDMSKAKYVGSQRKLLLTCKKHNEDNWTRASDFLKTGSMGCKQCFSETIKKLREYTKEDCVKHFKKIYKDNEFLYHDMKYVDHITPAKMYCNIHKKYFWTKPSYHKAGVGCEDCSSDYQNGQYVLDAWTRMHQRNIDPDDVSFSYTYKEFKDIYINHRWEYCFDIYCPTCGSQDSVILNSFLHGYGVCKNCTYANVHRGHGYRHGYDFKDNSHLEDVDGILYHVRFTRPDGTTFDKVGVTSKSTEERFSRLTRILGYKVEIIRECKDTLKTCLDMESLILESLDIAGLTYRIHDFKGTYWSGWTECFPTRKAIH